MNELKSKADYIEKSNQKGKVVIEIYAPGCSPCQNLKEKVLPHLEDIESFVIDGTTYYEILDIIKNKTGSPVSGVPVLMLYKDGQFIKRINGFTNKKNIESEFV